MSAVAPASGPLLATRALRVQAGPRQLVQALSLSIRPGEFWVLLGPNGAGKTWLLDTLAGLRTAAGGEIDIAGRALAGWPVGELARWRGHVPQRLVDAFAAPVLDLVLQGRHPHLSRWHWEGQADQVLAEQALARVGLAGFGSREVTSLSGGERHRVALATLALQDPPLWLLDEPLAHLDLAQQLRTLDRLVDEVAQRQRAVVMSVHDLSLAQRVATHALLLAGNGRTVAGPTAEVMTSAMLSEAYGHPLHRHEAQGRVWWLPA